ncbi:MAG: hypothetical protein JRJ12_02355 [Deltaproteobacteria bacterium]|nr:hypothetical protein [Deltaproteobacteria bacterium]
MPSYFLSMNPLVELEENLPNLAPLDDPTVVKLIRGARGVVMPPGLRPARYRKIAALARDWFPRLEAKFSYPGKTRQTMLFQHLAVRHPRTAIFHNRQHLLMQTVDGLPLAYPFVLKGDRGGGGVAVFPVCNSLELEAALGKLPEGEPLLLQEWIKHQGRDLRVVVVGARIVSYFRVGNGGFYNNICRGGRIDRHGRPKQQMAGIRAVARFCKVADINLAAFDLMFPDQGPPMFIEINFNFGRKGLGGTAGYRRLFQQAVALWQQGRCYPDC